MKIPANPLGRKIRWQYCAPAISCCMNGRMIEREGRITCVHKRQPNNGHFSKGDYTVDGITHASPKEVTHMTDAGGRWQKITHET